MTSKISCAHYDDGTSDPENGMFSTGKGRCLFGERNWSEASKPERCEDCPDRKKEPVLCGVITVPCTETIHKGPFSFGCSPGVIRCDNCGTQWTGVVMTGFREKMADSTARDERSALEQVRRDVTALKHTIQSLVAHYDLTPETISSLDDLANALADATPNYTAWEERID